MDTDDPLATPMPKPTAARPLLGLTILAVEDSRFASDAMRLLCLRSGARIRRADCLRSARRHLRVYRPSVVLVDLGLPDGRGTELIRDLDESQPRVQAILAISGDPETEGEAMAAGADGFIAKPIETVGLFQEKVLSLLPADRQPNGLRQVEDAAVEPDILAYRDDMAHIADVLEGQPDGETLDYVAQFLSGVARLARDNVLADAAQALAEQRAAGARGTAESARIAGLVQNRMADRAVI